MCWRQSVTISSRIVLVLYIFIYTQQCPNGKIFYFLAASIEFSSITIINRERELLYRESRNVSNVYLCDLYWLCCHQEMASRSSSSLGGSTASEAKSGAS